MARPIPISPPTPATGVIIPLYSYPGAAWDAIIQAKNAYPSVPIVAVINPNNGPGAAQDPNYVTWINNLRAAGVTVLGYVWTHYAARGLSSIESDIGAYKSWYGVSGIFFDEMSSAPGHESYYSTLNNYAQSLGLVLTVGNPGASVPASYIGTLDCIVIYENLGTPTTAGLSSATMGMSKSNFAMIAYGVNSLSPSSESNASYYVHYLYLTNGAMPNPYTSLPSYFSALVATLYVPPQNTPVTVWSESVNGSSLNGMWAVVQYDGSVVASGFTPLTFYGTPGLDYTMSVSDYGSYSFNHWGNWNTSPSMTVTISHNNWFTAVFSP